MKLITFLAEFIKHPKHIGAIAPSSKLLAKRMVDAIDFEDAGYIVELGPGTGVFTREIMRRKKKHTKFILIEINEVFARDLQQQFRDDPNVFVIHGSAEKIQTYMTGFVWTLCIFYAGVYVWRQYQSHCRTHNEVWFHSRECSCRNIRRALYR